MLPPLIELRVGACCRSPRRGASHLRVSAALPNRSEAEIAELALLELCEIEGKPWHGALTQLPGGEVRGSALLRRGQLAARGNLRATPARGRSASSPENEEPPTGRMRTVISASAAPKRACGTSSPKSAARCR